MPGEPEATPPVRASIAGLEEAEAPAARGASGRRSIRRALSLSLRTTFVAQLLLAISGILLARVLGDHDRGELAAAILWPTVIGGLVTVGLTESITFHVASDPDDSGRFLGSGLALAGVASLIGVVVAMALIPLALSGMGSDVVDAGLLYGLPFIPLITVAVVFIGTLNGLHRYGWFSAVRISLFGLMLAAQIALIVLDASSVRSLVIAFVACQGVTTILAGCLVAKSQPGPLQCDRGTMRTIFAYGIRSSAGTTSSLLNQRLDQLVISVVMSASQLGLYVVAVNLTSVAGLIGNAVAYATLPNVASLPRGARQTLLARRLVAMTMLLSAALAVPVAFFAPELISLLFGSDFRPAATAARILALAAIVFATARALEAVLRAVGRPLDAGLGELTALGATGLGLAVLVPWLGISGAAATSLLAYGVAVGWMLRRAGIALEVAPIRFLLPDREGLQALRTQVHRRVVRRTAV